MNLWFLYRTFEPRSPLSALRKPLNLRALSGKNEAMYGSKFMVRESDLLRLTIPNPHKGEIGKDLLAEILREANIQRKDWEKLK